jgi:hypothetical protein
MRHLRILLVIALAATAAAALEEVLGLDSEGLALSVDGLIHACLGIAAVFVAALSDREFFGLK